MLPILGSLFMARMLFFCFKSSLKMSNQRQFCPNFEFILRFLFLIVDIPLSKLDHPQFKNFIEKYTEHEAPSRTTIRRIHVDKVYNSCIAEAREQLGDDPLYVSLDGTSDIGKRSVAAFIIGSMKDNTKGPYLINMKIMHQSTAEAYKEFFHESLNSFFGDGKSNSLCS